MSNKKTSKNTKLNGTLPDYLCEGLDLVFVGLNPGLYSAKVGHYFAWLLEWGIGLTDIVKRPTHGIHEVSITEFRRGAKVLREKIERYQPRVVCFIGLTGYRICCGNENSPGNHAAH